MTKTWEGVVAGGGVGLGPASGGLVTLEGLGDEGVWAVALGPQAARRHEQVTRANSRIPDEPTRRT
jgi:hypothetical protein